MQYIPRHVNRRQTRQNKKKRLCIKCLKSFHGRNCKAIGCKHCKGYHNTLLHKAKASDVESSTESKSSNNKVLTNKGSTVTQIAVASISNRVPASLIHYSAKESHEVLLSTAIVMVRDCNGTLHECHALLDSGAQSNFITQIFSKKLNLRSKTINITLKGINCTTVNAVQQVHTAIQSRTGAYQLELPLIIVDQITEKLPNSRINVEMLNIPLHLPLADPNFHLPGDIDILLGASIFWEVLGTRRIQKTKSSHLNYEKRI